MKSREVRHALLGLLIVLGLFLPMTVGSQDRANKAITDPLTAATFSLAIDGVEVAVFSELLSLRSGHELEDFEVAGPRIRTGNRMPPSVTLKRGMTGDLSLWTWHVAALGNPNARRRNASITIYDTAGAPIARYHLEQAWPAKVEIGALKAGASEVLMETVTIVCESIQRVNV